MKLFHACLIPALALLSIRSAQANPLENSLEIGTSVSQSYGARSVVSNPAGLAYETALNGVDLGTAFTYGLNRDQKSDFSGEIQYGVLGLGAERLASLPDPTSRYRIALGLPIASTLFGGLRYSFWNTQSAGRWDDLALGLQWRQWSQLSFGTTVSRLNTPSVGGVKLSPLWVFGATWRPIPRFEIAVDGSTPSDGRFFKDWGYQASAGVEVFRGFQMRVGYHSDYQFFAGLQVGLGHASGYTSVQPGSRARAAVIGFQGAALPYRSPIGLPTTLKMKIDDDLSEQAVAPSLFSAGKPSLLTLLRTLQDAESKPHVSSVAIDLKKMPLGLASALELHQALVRLRQKGKRVEVYLGNAGTKEYLIASGASLIYLAPGGELRLVGLRAEHYFIKGTLDKIGLEGEFLAKGEYKSAPEMFTRTESSPTNRAAVLEELRLAEDHIRKVLQDSRAISVDQWKKIRELALLSPQAAVREKLVDGIQTFSAEIDRPDRNTLTRERVSERSNTLALPPRIAVIVADGTILNERARLLGLAGRDQVTPEGMRKKLEVATEDPRTRAIVVRVNSPGGEILASDLIATQIRTARASKPVWISFGDVAASGGYYLATAGERIYASPLSITGSIGVFVGKFNAKGLYQYLRLNKEILSHGPYPGLMTEDRPWSKAERDVMQRRLDEYYDSFVSLVASSRNLSKEKAESAAKGRVWLGSQAKDLGLVDNLGGYREVLSDAAQAAGCDLEDCEVSTIRTPLALGDWFAENAFGMGRATSILGSEELLRAVNWMEMIENQPYLYLSPMASIR